MDWSVITISLMGITLGLSAGFSPGPLTTLVISETMARGLRGGLGASMAPLMTDLPIIAGAIFIISKMAKADALLACITLAGGVFLIYLAWGSFRQVEINTESAPSGPGSLTKAVIANVLSPNPYIFWMTIGGPIFIESSQKSHISTALFMAGFYICLIGSKVSMALIVAQSRWFLAGVAYRVIMSILGALLFVYAGIFVYQGLLGLSLI